MNWIKTLIHPIPYRCTGDAAIGIDYVPILLQVAHRVAHGVGILAANEGLLRLLLSLVLQHLGGRVAEVVQGRVARMTIVEGQSRGIETAHGIVHRLDVRANASLIAKAPEDDAGVIEVALHQRLGTVDMGSFPRRIFAHHAVGIAIPVALLIGLVHHIDAEAVAQFVEVFTVGVVRGAQEVDVGLLHQF